MRKCSRCGEEEIDLAFGINRREKDGLNKACRECHAKDQVKYQNRRKMKGLLKYRAEWEGEA